MIFDTGNGDPASGTFDISFTQFLPQSLPGQRYQVQTGFSLLSDTNGTTALGFTNGHINFSLTPVPEPATVGMLFIGAIATFRRHRHS